MNKLHEISPNVGKIIFYQFSNRCDQIVYTRCRIGHSRMTHKFLIGEDPPTCSLCRIPLSIKHVLLDCAGFNYNLIGKGMENYFKKNNEFC